MDTENTVGVAKEERGVEDRRIGKKTLRFLGLAASLTGIAGK